MKKLLNTLLVTTEDAYLSLDGENVVVDPVMYAKDGTALMAPQSIETFKAEILPLADVLKSEAKRS